MRRWFLLLLVFGLSALCRASVPEVYAASLEDHLPHLCRAISAYNMDAHQEALEQNSYRGQEGLLMADPETGKTLGLKVLMDDTYIRARALYREAEDLKEEILGAMRIRESAPGGPGGHDRRVLEPAIRYNRITAEARELMILYQKGLSPRTDDRLNKDICFNLLEKLVRENVEKARFNLRDALGLFYNQCQGIRNSGPLNLQNIRFVNHVFDQFLKSTVPGAETLFDLDISTPEVLEASRQSWRGALGRSSTRFVKELEEAFRENRHSGHPVDPLLFLALMRQESDFDHLNVSHVGAAGLTQIMPATARSLGMTEIYDPPYFSEAGALLAEERRLKAEVWDLILTIESEKDLARADKARGLTQQAMACNKRWKELYGRYKRELLTEKSDDRLKAEKAIQYGLKYFSQMMKMQDDDMSLALASYNAGPHRVKQYNGLPPFEETIDFRNKVLNYYREYRERIENHAATQEAFQTVPPDPGGVIDQPISLEMRHDVGSNGKK